MSEYDNDKAAELARMFSEDCPCDPCENAPRCAAHLLACERFDAWTDTGRANLRRSIHPDRTFYTRHFPRDEKITHEGAKC